MLDDVDKTRLTLVLMEDPRKTPAEALRARQGRKITDLRKLHGLTQTQLAERIEEVTDGKIAVTKAAVSEWERGKSSPRPHHQVAIARALSTPWSMLFGLDGEAA